MRDAGCGMRDADVTAYPMPASSEHPQQEASHQRRDTPCNASLLIVWPCRQRSSAAGQRHQAMPYPHNPRTRRRPRDGAPGSLSFQPPLRRRSRVSHIAPSRPRSHHRVNRTRCVGIGACTSGVRRWTRPPKTRRGNWPACLMSRRQRQRSRSSSRRRRSTRSFYNPWAGQAPGTPAWETSQRRRTCSATGSA